MAKQKQDHKARQKRDQGSAGTGRRKTCRKCGRPKLRPGALERHERNCQGEATKT